MTQPNQSELVETILSILGIVDRTSGNRPEQIATLGQELTAHTNAEIAKVLDRLESNKETLYWWTGGEYDKTTAIDMRAIAAERAELKEVK